MKTILLFVFVFVWNFLSVFANEAALDSENDISKEQSAAISKMGDPHFSQVAALRIKKPEQGTFPSVLYKNTRFQKLQKVDFERWFASKGSALPNDITHQYTALYGNRAVGFPQTDLLFWYDNYLYRPPTDGEKIYHFQSGRKNFYVVPTYVQQLLNFFIAQPLLGTKEEFPS